ncbi:hypothetical protein Droror1_Dr00021957 [Drosera rotundifolia]
MTASSNPSPSFVPSTVDMETDGLGRPPDPPDPEPARSSDVPMSFRDRLVSSFRSRHRIQGDLIASGRATITPRSGPLSLPRVAFHNSVREELVAPWTRSVVVKLLGKSLSYPVMERGVRQLWNPRGEMVFLDLNNGFFMARFEKDEDLERVIFGGPCVIMGHYLTVRRWSPSFDPDSESIDMTLVWVRITGLPIIYYESNVLQTIATTIGKPYKVDDTTLNAARGRFARICVELDLSVSLVGAVIVDDKRYQVEYEGLHIICFHCGLYGHGSDACPTRTRNPPVEQSMAGASSQQPDGMRETGEASLLPLAKGNSTSRDECLGPWMTVARRARKPKNSESAVGKTGLYLATNRFRTLVGGISTSGDAFPGAPSTHVSSLPWKNLPPGGHGQRASSHMEAFQSGPEIRVLEVASSGRPPDGADLSDFLSKVPRVPSLVFGVDDTVGGAQGTSGLEA